MTPSQATTVTPHRLQLGKAAQALESTLRLWAECHPHSPVTATWRHSTTAALVLGDGRPWLPARLTKEERAAVRAAVKDFRDNCGRFEFHHCYYNAQKLAHFGREDGLRYVEGYLQHGGGIPLLHGWVTLNGKLIDPTTVTDEMVNGGFPEPALTMGLFDVDDRAYRGIELHASDVAVRNEALGGGYVGLLDSDWQVGWPLHRDGPRLHPRR